jgi:hypothetical protein
MNNNNTISFSIWSTPSNKETVYTDFKNVVRFLIQNDISFDSQMDLENYKVKFKVDDTSLNNSQKNMLKSYIIKEDLYEVTYSLNSV